MQIELGTPQPKQILFLTDKHKYVAFGGARGGGKSWAVRFKSVLLALKHSGIKILIIRKTYKELENNHIKPTKELLKVGTKGSPAKYNDSKKEMNFYNGSTIFYGYCMSEGDVDRYQGLEVDVEFVDEATQLSESQLKQLSAIVRGVNSFPKRIYYTCNPGGQGMGYIRRIFIDKKFEIGEHEEDYSFIQSLVTDNEALLKSNPDYLKQLEALPPKLKEAWLNGRWDVWDGAYFEEFRATPDPQKIYELGVSEEQAMEEGIFTHVIKPFEPPKNWTVYRSYDWGYGKPFSCAWHVVDEDGVIYRILELYGCTGTPNEGVKWSNKQQFDKIAEIEREHPWLAGKRILGVADPSIWDGSHGISAAEEAEKHQLWFEPGQNARIPGWMQIRERMKFDENGKAMLYFFENCNAIIRCMPLMMFDAHKPEDLDTNMEDHCLDDLRYCCMQHVIKPRNLSVNNESAYDPLNMFEFNQTKNRAQNRAVIWR